MQAQQLATPGAFADNPSLVWEFYSYRREVMHSKEPNPGQYSMLIIEFCSRAIVDLFAFTIYYDVLPYYNSNTYSPQSYC